MNWSEEHYVKVALPEVAVPAWMSRHWSRWGHLPGSFVPEADRPNCIYFLQGDDGGPVKIGRTARNPHWRLDAVQTGYPFGDLRVVGLVLGHRHLETELHERFATSRLHGEWFAVTTDLVAFIRALKEVAAP